MGKWLEGIADEILSKPAEETTPEERALLEEAVDLVLATVKPKR